MDLGEIEDLVPGRRRLAGDQVELIVAVEMHLKRRDRRFFCPVSSSLDDVRIAGGRHECREPVEPGDDTVLDFAGRNLAGPAYYCRHAEATFEAGALAACERGLPAIRPGKVLGAVVGGEHDDGVVVETVVLQICHDRADNVVELRHAGFLDAPAVLRVAHRLVFFRQVRHDVHARRVQPDEERLFVGARLVHELRREVEDFVVDRLHALGIELASVLDLLFADLAPARHHRLVIRIGGPAMDHVARADGVLQGLRVVPMRRVLHRVEVVQVAEKFVEAVHGRQKPVQIAEVVLAELAGRISHGLENLGDRDRLVRDAELAIPPVQPSSARSGSVARR